MKIALFCSSLHFGGIEKVALILAGELARKKDLSVDLVVLRGKGDFLSMASSAVNLVCLDCTSQPLALFFPFSKLARYFSEARPDVVLSLGHSTNCLVACAKLLRRFPFRLLVSEHSSFGTRMEADAKFHQWRRIARVRFLYRHAELCVCVSQGVADELTDLRVVPREKIRVIYNPAAYFWPVASTKEPPGHFWLTRADEECPPMILSAGRLIGLKGLDTLIRAFARLRRDMGIDARLMILGEGPERPNLENLAKTLNVERDVCFTGFVLNPQIYMEKAAIVALSSHYEGLPNVLIEALSCGVNIVSTDCKSGPREILEDGRWGSLVPVGDDGAFAAALRDALTNPLPAGDLRERAKYFSVERSVEAYYDVILGDRKNPETTSEDAPCSK